jgi:hypothetical protein
MKQTAAALLVHRSHILPVLLFATIFVSAFTSNASADPNILISPEKGPYNTKIKVTGSGFKANSTVKIKYGTTEAITVTADKDGKITATITANGDTKGSYGVQAFQYNNDTPPHETAHSNQKSFEQTSGKKSSHVVEILDFPRTMLLASVDLKGKRLGSVETVDICLGENQNCFGEIPTGLSLGNGDLIVSTGLGFQNDASKYSAQQFNFHYDDLSGFVLAKALDGPVIAGTQIDRNCWSLYDEGSKVSLTHLKSLPGNDVQLVGNAYHPDNATAGKTMKYLPKIDEVAYTVCLGNGLHSVITQSGNDFNIQYKGNDKVVRTLPLPVFVTNGNIIAADMTNQYETTHSSNELLIVRTAVQQGNGDYTTQVFTLPLDVSQPQWEVAGAPTPITKPVLSDKHAVARSFHSVAIDPFGRFAVYTYPSHASGVVKTQQLDPGTGEKLGKSHVVFRSTDFSPEAGPYGLGLSLLF